METSAPLSWVTSSSSEEDAGSGEPLYLPLFQEYFEFNFPRRTAVQVQDAYSVLLNSSPRRQVPLGPNHQADIPLWCPDATQEEYRSSSHPLDDEKEQNVLGTTVFCPSESENSSFGDIRAGQGRKDCGCSDEGSIRCVQQHVKEAREKMREVFGEEKFSEFGFYDMGEEVAFKWTDEEGRMFHDVVFSNPASLGKNFWRHLSAVFPSRTKQELVSYYFNVFMLRRRAVQNRSNLDIDSDDDEWHGNVGGFDGVEDDEDSVVESFEEIPECSEDEIDNEGGGDKENDDDDDNDSDDGEGDGDGVSDGKNKAACAEDATGKHNPSFQNSKSQCGELTDVVSSDFFVHHNMVNSNHIMEGCGIQEDSSTSSETPEYRLTSFGSVMGPDAQSRESCDFKTCPPGESRRSNDGSETESVFFLDHCDPQVWDSSCSAGLMKGVDFLPTCNIIEEIFGPSCTSKNK